MLDDGLGFRLQALQPPKITPNRPVPVPRVRQIARCLSPVSAKSPGARCLSPVCPKSPGACPQCASNRRGPVPSVRPNRRGPVPNVLKRDFGLMLPTHLRPSRGILGGNYSLPTATARCGSHAPQLSKEKLSHPNLIRAFQEPFLLGSAHGDPHNTTGNHRLSPRIGSKIHEPLETIPTHFIRQSLSTNASVDLSLLKSHSLEVHLAPDLHSLQPEPSTRSLHPSRPTPSPLSTCHKSPQTTSSAIPPPHTYTTC